MNTEAVGYRYTDDELATLRLVLDLDAPLGSVQRTLEEEAYNKAIESLTAAGIVVPAGDELYIDRLTTLLLTEASRSARCLRIISQNHVTLLHQAQEMYIVDEIFAGIHTITPIQTLDAASGYITSSLVRHVLPAETAVITEYENEGLSEEASDPDSLLRAVHQQLASFNI